MEDGCCCMLSDYKNEQELAYSLLVRDIENNCVYKEDNVNDSV